MEEISSDEEEIILYTVLLGLLGLLCSYILYRRISGSETAAPRKPSGIPAQSSEAEKVSGPPITVFFGSQTGTAEDMATKFTKEIKRHGFNPKLTDMEDFEMDGMEELAEQEYCVFFTATHGEGDPTDNSRSFYEWLKDKERQSNELSGVKYTVFGLGNTQYEDYQAMGRFFDKRMAALGATRVAEYGEGNDDDDIEADYEAWKEKSIPLMKAHFGLEDIVLAAELEYKLVDVPAKSQADASEKGMSATFLAASTKSVIDNQVWLPAKLTAKRELQTNSERSTLHLEIEPADNSGDYSFSPGDHIGVRAENNPKMVGAIATRLGYDLKQVISLKAIDRGTTRLFRFPCPCTVRVALSAWLDIQATPRPEFLLFVSRYASDPEEQAKLEELGSSRGKQEYTSTVLDMGMNLLELLDRFKSLQIPLFALLELLPRLTTRYYSIASSLRLHRNRIDLCASVVRYANQEPSGAEREGIATTWFDRMRLDSTLHICMRSAGFHLPTDKTKPVLMVGPGTGLAPFRGYIQEYQAIKRTGAPTGKLVLFFGCRHEKQDYIYREELEAALGEGALTHLFTAFSRDQKQKVYVQHLMQEQKELIAQCLLKEDGSFYICGDAKSMANDVHKALLECFTTAGGLSYDQAEAAVAKMKADKRYLTDVWA